MPIGRYAMIWFPASGASNGIPDRPQIAAAHDRKRADDTTRSRQSAWRIGVVCGADLQAAAAENTKDRAKARATPPRLERRSNPDRGLLAYLVPGSPELPR